MNWVATVLTVYGIETILEHWHMQQLFVQLQQYLPFTVLKLSATIAEVKIPPTGCNSTYRLRY